MFKRFTGLSKRELHDENIRRSRAAGAPVGTEPEKPVGVVAYRKLRKQSAKRADRAADAATRTILRGGKVGSK